MKSKLVAVSILILTFIVSSVIVINSEAIQNGEFTLLDDEFIISFLGIMTGFALTIIAFMYANLEKIKQTAKDRVQAAEMTKLETHIVRIYKEIKEDVFACFVALIVALLLIVLQAVPIMDEWTFIILSKNELFSALKLTSIFTTVYSIFDIAICTFRLIDVSNHVPTE